MKNKTFLIIASVVLTIPILLVSYLYYSVDVFATSSRNIKRELTNQQEVVAIVIDENAQYPHSMDLIMTGNINGIGKLSFGPSSTYFYRTDTITNDFNVDYNHGDWYSDSCVIKYEPITATEGDLKIDCKIYSSK